MRHPLADAIKREMIMGDGDAAIRVDEETDLETARLEKHIAGCIGRAILKKYPKRQWWVHVDCPNKIVRVQCPTVSARMGYLFPMNDMHLHAMQEKAVKVAGEILERFGVSRNKAADNADMLALPRNPLRPSERIGPDSEPDWKHGVN